MCYADATFDALYARLERDHNSTLSCSFSWDDHPLFFEAYPLILLRADNVQRYLDCAAQNCSKTEHTSAWDVRFMQDVQRDRGFVAQNRCFENLDLCMRLAYAVHFRTRNLFNLTANMHGSHDVTHADSLWVRRFILHQNDEL